LADIFLIDWKSDPQPQKWGDIAALAGWALLPFYFLDEVASYVPRSAFPYLLFLNCWASFQSVFVRGFLSSSFIVTVGGMCYSIYLLHYPLLRILGPHLSAAMLTSSRWWNITFVSLIWAFPVLIISSLFFLLIEKPCMQKKWHEWVVAIVSRKT
jgi:peptidoglycan/LPS O-acetylase OafA/YrhL